MGLPGAGSVRSDISTTRRPLSTGSVINSPCLVQTFGIQQVNKRIIKRLTYLLVLLMNKARHLLEALLIVGLRTEIDYVGGQTSHTPLAISEEELFQLKISQLYIDT